MMSGDSVKFPRARRLLPGAALVVAVLLTGDAQSQNSQANPCDNPQFDCNSAQLCRDLGGDIDPAPDNRQVCSNIDRADTFCIVNSPNAFPCRGLYNHVIRCNRIYNRPALNPLLCHSACPEEQTAVGGNCVITVPFANNPAIQPGPFFAHHPAISVNPQNISGNYHGIRRGLHFVYFREDQLPATFNAQPVTSEQHRGLCNLGNTPNNFGWRAPAPGEAAALVTDGRIIAQQQTHNARTTIFSNSILVGEYPNAIDTIFAGQPSSSFGLTRAFHIPLPTPPRCPPQDGQSFNVASGVSYDSANPQPFTVTLFQDLNAAHVCEHPPLPNPEMRPVVAAKDMNIETLENSRFVFKSVAAALYPLDDFRRHPGHFALLPQTPVNGYAPLILPCVAPVDADAYGEQPGVTEARILPELNSFSQGEAPPTDGLTVLIDNSGNARQIFNPESALYPYVQTILAENPPPDGADARSSILQAVEVAALKLWTLDKTPDAPIYASYVAPNAGSIPANAPLLTVSAQVGRWTNNGQNQPVWEIDNQSTVDLFIDIQGVGQFQKGGAGEVSQTVSGAGSVPVDTPFFLRVSVRAWPKIGLAANAAFHFANLPVFAPPQDAVLIPANTNKPFSADIVIPNEIIGEPDPVRLRIANVQNGAAANYSIDADELVITRTGPAPTQGETVLVELTHDRMRGQLTLEFLFRPAEAWKIAGPNEFVLKKQYGGFSVYPLATQPLFTVTSAVPGAEFQILGPVGGTLKNLYGFHFNPDSARRQLEVLATPPVVDVLPFTPLEEIQGEYFISRGWPNNTSEWLFLRRTTEAAFAATGGFQIIPGIGAYQVFDPVQYECRDETMFQTFTVRACPLRKCQGICGDNNLDDKACRSLNRAINCPETIGPVSARGDIFLRDDTVGNASVEQAYFEYDNFAPAPTRLFRHPVYSDGCIPATQAHQQGLIPDNHPFLHADVNLDEYDRSYGPILWCPPVQRVAKVEVAVRHPDYRDRAFTREVEYFERQGAGVTVIQGRQIGPDFVSLRIGGTAVPLKATVSIMAAAVFTLEVTADVELFNSRDYFRGPLSPADDLDSPFPLVARAATPDFVSPSYALTLRYGNDAPNAPPRGVLDIIDHPVYLMTIPDGMRYDFAEPPDGFAVTVRPLADLMTVFSEERVIVFSADRALPVMAHMDAGGGAALIIYNDNAVRATLTAADLAADASPPGVLRPAERAAFKGLLASRRYFPESLPLPESLFKTSVAVFHIPPDRPIAAGTSRAGIVRFTVVHRDVRNIEHAAGVVTMSLSVSSSRPTPVRMAEDVHMISLAGQGPPLARQYPLPLSLFVPRGLEDESIDLRDGVFRYLGAARLERGLRWPGARHFRAGESSDPSARHPFELRVRGGADYLERSGEYLLSVSYVNPRLFSGEHVVTARVVVLAGNIPVTDELFGDATAFGISAEEALQRMLAMTRADVLSLEPQAKETDSNVRNAILNYVRGGVDSILAARGRVSDFVLAARGALFEFEAAAVTATESSASQMFLDGELNLDPKDAAGGRAEIVNWLFARLNPNYDPAFPAGSLEWAAWALGLYGDGYYLPGFGDRTPEDARADLLYVLQKGRGDGRRLRAVAGAGHIGWLRRYHPSESFPQIGGEVRALIPPDAAGRFQFNLSEGPLSGGCAGAVGDARSGMIVSAEKRGGRRIFLEVLEDGLGGLVFCAGEPLVFGGASSWYSRAMSAVDSGGAVPGLLGNGRSGLYSAVVPIREVRGGLARSAEIFFEVDVVDGGALSLSVARVAARSGAVVSALENPPSAVASRAVRSGFWRALPVAEEIRGGSAWRSLTGGMTVESDGRVRLTRSLGAGTYYLPVEYGFPVLTVTRGTTARVSDFLGSAPYLLRLDVLHDALSAGRLLSRAAAAGDFDGVSGALALAVADANRLVTLSGDFGERALHAAVRGFTRSGDVGRLRAIWRLAEHGADPWLLDDDGFSPMHVALSVAASSGVVWGMNALWTAPFSPAGGGALPESAEVRSSPLLARSSEGLTPLEYGLSEYSGSEGALRDGWALALSRLAVLTEDACATRLESGSLRTNAEIADCLLSRRDL